MQFPVHNYSSDFHGRRSSTIELLPYLGLMNKAQCSTNLESLPSYQRQFLSDICHYGDSTTLQPFFQNDSLPQMTIESNQRSTPFTSSSLEFLNELKRAKASGQWDGLMLQEDIIED